MHDKSLAHAKSVHKETIWQRGTAGDRRLERKLKQTLNFGHVTPLYKPLLISYLCRIRHVYRGFILPSREVHVKQQRQSNRFQAALRSLHGTTQWWTKTRLKDHNILNSCKSDFNCNAKRKHKDNFISITEKKQQVWIFYVKMITEVLKTQLDLNLIVHADSSVAIICPVPVWSVFFPPRLTSLCSWRDQPLLGALVIVTLQLPCERKVVKGKDGREDKRKGWIKTPSKRQSDLSVSSRTTDYRQLRLRQWRESAGARERW